MRGTGRFDPRAVFDRIADDIADRLAGLRLPRRTAVAGFDRLEPIYRQTVVGIVLGLIITIVLAGILTSSVPRTSGPAAFGAGFSFQL